MTCGEYRDDSGVGLRKSGQEETADEVEIAFYPIWRDYFQTLTRKKRWCQRQKSFRILERTIVASINLQLQEIDQLIARGET